MRHARRRLAFLAGVSIPAMCLPGTARAATVAGAFINPRPPSMRSTSITSPHPIRWRTSDRSRRCSIRGAATAIAEVSCGETATCTNPGALEQVAIGLNSASNQIQIQGTQGIHATATATGASALARALIDTAIFQDAVAPSAADNRVSVTGVIDVPLHAKATATAGMRLPVPFSITGSSSAQARRWSRARRARQ